MLDTSQSVPTPEGVDLSLVPAGPVPRATAFVIDLLLRGALLVLALLLIGSFGHVGIGLMLLAYFLVEWLYPVAFELLAQGATPGKRVVGLRVVEADGRPVGVAASVIRNLLRAADFLPFLFGFGLVAMLFHPRFQRLGDMAAGTLVVWAPEPPQAPVLPLAPAMAPGLKLRLAEQKAIIAFAERSARLSPARQEELADLLQPLTRARGRAGVEKLRGLARWLAGER
ncbi:MAG TPA: RDD family protein [Moraxellaceae bacterium]|nr:RDD family protein [Moraxellaceae bacterium]